MNRTNCEIFTELAENSPYTAVIAWKAVISLSGALLSAIQLKIRGVDWLKHAHSKCLFLFYYWIIILVGAAYGLLYAWEFVRLRIALCFDYDYRVVLIVRTTGLSSITSSHFLMVLISLERLFASVRPEQFEKMTSRRSAFVSAFLIIFVSFFLTFWSVSDHFTLFGKTKNVATIDLKTPENAEIYAFVVDVMLWTYLPSSLIFIVDVYMNIVRKTKEHKVNQGNSLSKVYQLSENRAVVLTMIPLECTNVTFTLFATIAQFVYNAVKPEASYIQRALFVEGTALSPYFPLAFFFIIEWRMRKMRTANKVVTVLPSNEAGDEHFRQLDELFDRVPRRESAPVV